MADLDIRCSTNDDESTSLPSLLLVLLRALARPSPARLLGSLVVDTALRARAAHYRLAPACRFLWSDDDLAFVHWEVVDMSRKSFLSALILFVDTKYGASRLMHLII